MAADAGIPDHLPWFRPSTGMESRPGSARGIWGNASGEPTFPVPVPPFGTILPALGKSMPSLRLLATSGLPSAPAMLAACALVSSLVLAGCRGRESAGAGAGHRKPRETALWIWGGHALPAGSAGKPLYLFQGKLTAAAEGYRFRKQGLYPYPAGARRLHLVFRLDGMDTSRALPARMLDIRDSWIRHGNAVPGFQFDYDCPTAKLEAYSVWMRGIRKALGDSVALGISGLADWALSGEKASLRKLLGSVDEAVFQLYAGPRKIPRPDRILDRLESLAMPYKVGFLSGDSAGIALLADPSAYPHCVGYVIFLLPGAT